jgi:hypothetical protein
MSSPLPSSLNMRRQPQATGSVTSHLHDVCMGLFRSCAQQGAAQGRRANLGPGHSHSRLVMEMETLPPSASPDGHAKPSLPAAPMTETETEALPPSTLPQHQVERPFGKFEVGSRVQYLSDTQGAWINATILEVDEADGTQDMTVILDIKKGKSVPVCRLRERPRDGKGGGGGGATAPSEPAPPMSTMMIVEGVGSSNSVASVC